MKLPAALFGFMAGMAVGGIVYEAFDGQWLKVATFVGILMVAAGGLHRISREGR